jgi:hypothetical protein
MAHPFPSVTSRMEARSRFGVIEFEPLLNSEQAADLLQIHHKTWRDSRHSCRQALALPSLRPERMVREESARHWLIA